MHRHAIKIHPWHHHQLPNMRDRHHTIIGECALIVMRHKITKFLSLSVVIALLQVKLNKYSLSLDHKAPQPSSFLPQQLQ